jgi:hypothetical protein
MMSDPPGRSYFEAILVAIRGAGQHMVTLGGFLGSAEQATAPGWKWQLLTAAERTHAEALACLDEADERLRRLGPAERLPPPLDQLPERLQAMRADLRVAEDRIRRAVIDAVSVHAGNA